MSKKYIRGILKDLQIIRYKLEDMQNCEDFDEAIAISLELACDIESIEESLDDKFKLGGN